MSSLTQFAARGVMLAAVATLTVARPASAAEKKWELSPYTVQVELAVEEPALGQALEAYLRERIFTTLHPLWSTKLEVAAGERRHLLLGGMSELDQNPPPDGNEFDKRMVLAVTSGMEGYTLACREWDKHTQLWGPVHCRGVRQELMLPEQSFDLLRDTFAPLARVEMDAKNEKLATLVFKGCKLPRRTEEATFGRVGEVYLPFLIRFDHTGEVLSDGVAAVPWTYLVLENVENDKWQATVQAGIRRPFSVRRRGRSEHLAIAVRNPPAPTRVRFHARHDPTQGLSGYEVFTRLADSDQTTPLGVTDATGSVIVEPTGAGLVTVFLRSDGQVLAKVPVAPGAKPLLDVPIADDSARLRAQADITTVREQLIDIVARRNILMARTRARVKEGKLDEARKLLEELDDLPGRAQFDQMLTSAERNPQNVSTDPRIQQRIKKQFTDTRELLGRFLDLRPISELREEVSAAGHEKKEPEEDHASLDAEDNQ